MSSERCTRAWQVEALADGRLGDADAASFERHLATCDTCREEGGALAQLEAAAEGLPELTSTPLERRRLRRELLRRAHGASTQAPHAPKLAWAATAALALAVAGAFVLWPARPQPRPQARPAPRATPEYVASTSADAVVRTLEGGATLRLSLERGELGLRVTPLRGDQRFIVQLPDGELEIKGTRFDVKAHDARTESVRVFEGRVALRLRGRSPLLLQAGDSYVSPEPAPAAAAIEAAASPALAPKRAAEQRVREAPAPLTDRAPSSTTPPADSTFTRAMSAFQAGDFGRAETLLEQFERERPSDGRVEDALFLRAVARARRGDAAGARAIARAYLERFPNGLRKPDAERLAR